MDTRLCLFDFYFILPAPLSCRRSILFMDVNDVFSMWPFDVLDEPIRLFYYIETGLYIHLTINHFFEVYRKDFAVMLLHHAATMGLLAWSWLFNFTRVRRDSDSDSIRARPHLCVSVLGVSEHIFLRLIVYV